MNYSFRHVYNVLNTNMYSKIHVCRHVHVFIPNLGLESEPLGLSLKQFMDTLHTVTGRFL